MKPVYLINGQRVKLRAMEVVACEAETLPQNGAKCYRLTGEYYTNVWRTPQGKLETYAGKPVKFTRADGRDVYSVVGQPL